MADDQSAGQAADTSSKEELARQQALKEQQMKEEAEQRQFEIERNRFVYEDIFFKKNKYRLTEQAAQELEWKTDWLEAHPDVKVLIEGYCDEGGSAEDNLALGARRAGEVESFFLRRGIARERLSVISYGKERPIATGDTEEARAKNRRVRTQIIEE
jgi:peptidoglycan-associated lipoprotein